MIFFGEEPLEPVARYIRFSKGTLFVQKNQRITLADLGCGPKIRYYFFSKKHRVQFEKYIGIDPLVFNRTKQEYAHTQTIQLITAPLKVLIPLDSNSVDCVVGFAFLEHIHHPKEILLEAIRVIKPGGKVIVTTPTYRAKLVLEVLSNVLGVISRREIQEHKQYFDKTSLCSMIPTDLHVHVYHEYFEWGLNNLLIIEKK